MAEKIEEPRGIMVTRDGILFWMKKFEIPLRKIGKPLKYPKIHLVQIRWEKLPPWLNMHARVLRVTIKGLFSHLHFTLIPFEPPFSLLLERMTLIEFEG